MTQPVATNQRFSRNNVCPICYGWPGSNPGCKGYVSDNPEYVYCTSGGAAGSLPRMGEGQYRHKMSGACNCGTTHGSVISLNAKAQAMKQPEVKRTLEETFDYGDGCYVDRFAVDAVKNGKQVKDHVQYQIVDGARVYRGFKKLYRLDEVKAADPKEPVFIAEGERKVNKLWEMGYVATCNVGGSGGWQSSYASELPGRKVLIWPDNDAPGAKFAEEVSKSLSTHGIKWFILNKLTNGLPDTGDVLDWVKIPGNDTQKLQSIVNEYLNAEYFEVLDYYDLISLPKPEWLIEPFLVKNYIACLFGPTQTAKSFWALHQAMSLALQGTKVLYLAGENSNGYGLRMQAWNEYHHHQPNRNYKLIRRPLNFLETEVIDKLILTINHVFEGDKPAFIIVDTLSKSYRGGDENSTTDMREFIYSCERLRDEYNASILVIHHNGKNGNTPRGSSSILGDFDTIIESSRVSTGSVDDKRVIYSCFKQKDAPEFEPVTYKIVPLGQHTIEQSCVIEEIETDRNNLPGNIGTSLRTSEMGKAVLDVIGMEIYEGGVGPTTIMDQLGIPHRADPKAKASFNRELEKLLAGQYVTRERKGKFTYYYLTSKGLDIIRVANFGF